MNWPRFLIIGTIIVLFVGSGFGYMAWRYWQIQQVMQVISHPPILFWGKVVDQDGQPVEDALVDYEVLGGTSRSDQKQQGHSDKNGLFSPDGLTGASLYISVSKEGYGEVQESSTPNATSKQEFDVGNGQPTKEQPVIFTLRRKETPEALVKVMKIIELGEEAEPKCFSLTDYDLKATVPEGQGDLMVSMALPAGRGSGRRFDWNCAITVPHGGLQLRETIGVIPKFLAPTEGYQPSVQQGENSKDYRWTGAVDRDYFVVLADGRYARLKISASVNNNSVMVEGYINPAPGQRSLEWGSTAAGSFR